MKYFYLLIVIIILLKFPSLDLNYRLGDIVTYEIYFCSKLTRFWYKFYYKNSIATEYLSKTGKIYDFDILHQIVKNRSRQLKSIPSEDELIFHLRIGDVVDEYNDNIDDILEKKKTHNYLISYEDIENTTKKLKDKKLNIKKIIIVGGYHIHGNHDKSIVYVNKIKEFLEKLNYKVETKIGNKDPDEDFLWLANSKNFLRSKGGFSNLVNKMVELNGGNVLKETYFKELK